MSGLLSYEIWSEPIQHCQTSTTQDNGPPVVGYVAVIPAVLPHILITSSQMYPGDLIPTFIIPDLSSSSDYQFPN